MSDEARIRRIERSLEQLLTRDHLIGDGARVYNSGNQSISNGVVTDLTFDSERFDYGGYHSTSSNTNRLTVPADGVYLITGSVEWAANATGLRLVTIRLNGATSIANHRQVGSSLGSVAQTVSTIYKATASQYFTLTVLQSSGGALNVTTQSNYSPEFAIWRIG